MLAHQTHTYAPNHHATPFLPPVPSPLSPRSVNIHGRGPVFMSDEPLKPQQRQAHPRPDFSKRAIKKAPLQGQDALKEKRRGMFLKKVRDGRDDKRYESRGEDIMRLDFVQRRKQWEAETARSAPLIPSDPIEEEVEDAPMSSAMQMSTQEAAPEDQVDEVALREQEELEALLSLLPGENESMQSTNQPEMGGNERHDEQMSEHFGSDDDDYDALFSDYMQSEISSSAPQQQKPMPGEAAADEMDMS